MRFVLDNSVAISWCFDDEINPATTQLLLKCQNEGAIVPAMFQIEFLSALLHGLKRKRITETGIQFKRQQIANLMLETWPAPDTQELEAIYQLALTHQLTGYDATYLELAQRLDVPLATLDTDLQMAARTIGVPLLIH